MYVWSELTHNTGTHRQGYAKTNWFLLTCDMLKASKNRHHPIIYVKIDLWYNTIH